MRVEEITETKEVVVKKLYIANDGTVFNNEEDCKKHEKTTELMSDYNKLVKGNVNEFDLFFEAGNAGCTASRRFYWQNGNGLYFTHD